MSSLGTGGGEFRCGISREDIATLLVAARRYLNEGNPAAALQAVVAALRSLGGEQAVTSTLRRAREVYENNARINEATDELTTLFAQCAIATLPPKSTSGVPETMAMEGTSQGQMMPDSLEVIRSSILAESGREQVVYDASADGSSFLCQQCGGVVSNSRRDEHLSYWCSAVSRN